MPRVARFKIAAVEALLRQLEYAPPETRQRQMQATERLIDDLDPQQNYPEEFIIFRITGYRPDHANEPITFVGEALLPDLVTLVQTLSEGLELKTKEEGEQPLTLEEVASRLRVSPKTIQRYRRQGLVFKYMRCADGVQRLVCLESTLERFAKRHTRQLQKAASFSRVNGDLEADLIEQARQLQTAEGCSLNEAALRLAQQVGRAHETIRQMLRRHDRRRDHPIFLEHGPLTDRDIMLIHRAWCRGLEPTKMASHFGKTKSSINRAVNRRRGDLLRSLTIHSIHLPTFDRPDAVPIILSGSAVTTGLPAQEWSDAIELIESVAAANPSSESDETALIAGLNFLKRQASSAMASLGEWPTTEALDAIETNLRWASLLKRRLVLIGLPSALRRIQHQFQLPLKDHATEELIALLKVAFNVIGHAADSIDPTRGQKLERLVSLAMDKALAKIVIPQMSGRAAARHAKGAVPLRDPMDALNPWDRWLNLRLDLHPFIARLEPQQRAVIESRYGLNGSPPMTGIGVSKLLRVSPIKITRLLQQSIRTLRSLARTAE